MDTSKDYIEQCRKAAEIQEWWRQVNNSINTKNRKKGDYFLYTETHENIYILSHEKHAGIFTGIKETPDLIRCITNFPMQLKDCTFIPSQAQLQAMVDLKQCEGFATICYQSNMWHMWWGSNDEFCVQGNTWEQLWLAFVMKKKYNKQWNGTEWVEWEGA